MKNGTTIPLTLAGLIMGCIIGVVSRGLYDASHPNHAMIGLTRIAPAGTRQVALSSLSDTGIAVVGNKIVLYRTDHYTGEWKKDGIALARKGAGYNVEVGYDPKGLAIHVNEDGQTRYIFRGFDEVETRASEVLRIPSRVVIVRGKDVTVSTLLGTTEATGKVGEPITLDSNTPQEHTITVRR